MSSTTNSRLILALFLSGSLNVLLLLSTFWNRSQSTSDTPFSDRPIFTQAKKEWITDHRSAVQVVDEFQSLPMRKLIRKLHQKHLVQDGFSRRDFALACLIGFHHFDFKRSTIHLPAPKQERVFLWKEGGHEVPLRLFPDLTNDHFQAIIEFAETEQWPLTTEGMFFLLKTGVRDASLVKAFTQSPPFRYVEMLFQRGAVFIPQEPLLDLVLEGEWHLLEGFYEEQKRRQDFSSSERQQFLFRYVQQGSHLAANLLLKTDGTMVAKKWHDQQISALLPLLESSELAEAFAYTILTSQRHQAVCELAAQFLYSTRGQHPPEPFSFSQAIQDFAPHLRTVREIEKAVTHQTPPPTPKEKVYLVEEGDSLWKIAKKERVDIEQLKAYNHLETELLIPGKALSIPPQ